MPPADFQVWLSRRLMIRRLDGELQPLVLEIGLPESPTSEEGAGAVAAFRLRPSVDSWRRIYGADPVQAVHLAIRMGEDELEAVGALWPDGRRYRGSDTRFPEAPSRPT